MDYTIVPPKNFNSGIGSFEMVGQDGQRFSVDEYALFCDLVNATENSCYDEWGFNVEFKFGETAYAVFGTAEHAWFRQSRGLEFTFNFNRIKYHPLCRKDRLVFVCFVEAEGTNEQPRLLLYHNLEDGYCRVIGFAIDSEEGEFKFPKQM